MFLIADRSSPSFGEVLDVVRQHFADLKTKGPAVDQVIIATQPLSSIQPRINTSSTRRSYATGLS
ncbi:hypothetical protein [Reyranella soli]|uniref:hypothetical protein n=1 Tax=Reyranella soli TaxID=1230389 RepID=UPI0011BF7B24|nr:hypothetical protein [Reyranella soli]